MKFFTYKLEEIVAEKIRSLIQRNRPRDIYDNWYFATMIQPEQFNLIKKVLDKKAEQKGIVIKNIEQFINDYKREQNMYAWEKSLHHQLALSNLPNFDDAYIRVKQFIEQILKH